MTSLTVQPGALDRIRLDDFTVTAPSGAKIKPHAGQSVWVHGYGRSAADTAAIGAALQDQSDQMAALGVLCSFVADEVVRWDVVNPRTGEAYPAPESSEAVATLPDSLLAFITRRLLGVESEGEGKAGSGS